MAHDSYHARIHQLLRDSDAFFRVGFVVHGDYFQRHDFAIDFKACLVQLVDGQLHAASQVFAKPPDKG